MDILRLTIMSVIFIYCFLMIDALRLNLKSPLKRLFSLAMLSFLIWLVCNLFIIYSDTSTEGVFWYKMSSASQTFSAAFVLHFFILFTGHRSWFRSRWIYLFFYLPQFIMLIGFLTGDGIISGFAVSETGAKSMIINVHFWLYYYVIMHFCYLSATAIILFLWQSKIRYQYEKRQSISIISPFFISLLLGVYLGLSSIIYNNFEMLMLLPTTAVFSTISIWFAALKYKLMVLTPSVAAEGILSTMADSVILVDSNMNILTVNNETCRILNYKKEALLGRNLGYIFAESQISGMNNASMLLKKCVIRDYETLFLVADGSTLPISFSSSEYRDENNVLVGYIIVFRDITEQKIAEQNLKHLAHYDFLTGLPNRLMLNISLKDAIEKATINNSMIALILLDIDRFKGINDVFGHDIGDNILVEVADKLKESIRSTDVIARLGGDEFLCIIEDVVSVDDINEVITRLKNAFVAKYKVGLNKLSITASMGVSIFPKDGNNAEMLLKNADIAMYHAKNLGKNNCQFFSPILGIQCSKKLLLENNLQIAVDNNEFVLHYQPIVNIETGNVIGIEALVRWMHPKLGLIPPMEFIPIAEETGCIMQIGEFVLRTACRQNSQWIKMGISNVPISVNLSPVQFQQADLVEMITDILKETGLESRFLQLEITEGTAMTDSTNVLSLMNRLNKNGILLIIDDFGIGYSTLNYLKKFPISMIKIDRFFIRNISNTPNDAAIVSALFVMAHSLGMKVIAEGVETLKQLEALRSLEWESIGKLICYGVQGYYFSKPVPAEIFIDILIKQQNDSEKYNVT